MFTKNRNRTLEKNLKLYFDVIIIYSIIICAVLFFALSIYIRSYSNMTNRINTLEEMYTAFERMEKSMYEYGFKEDEEYLKSYEEAHKVAQQSLALLREAEIPGNYRRNMMDLTVIFNKMEEQQEELKKIWLQKAEEGSEPEYYYVVYEQFQKVADSLERKKDILYQEINEDSLRNKAALEKRMRELLILILAALLVFFLLFWRITDLQGKKMITPIKALTEEAQRIKQNDLNHFLVMEQDCKKYHLEEIDTLSDAFETMLGTIQEQVIKLQENAHIKEELQRQELENLRVKNLLTVSELRGLQMHMNPHFLFNTLNMIRQNAYLGKTEKTVYLLEETAALLRYNLNYNGKLVTLQKELEGLEHYICLQEERFEDRISFEFTLEESFHQMEVPCFILQPLIENSISHGMKDTNSGLSVKIRTQYLTEEKKGCIIVEDNGRGMSQEELKKTEYEMRQDDWENKKSIGLSNVYKRLMLFSEEKAEMKIESKAEKGTRITIKIPYVRT